MSQIGVQIVNGQAQILIMEEENDNPNYNYLEMQRLLDKAKSRLFLGNDAAFLAPLMCSLEFKWTKSVPTCATDGINLWWNPDDFLGCTEKGRVSSIKHELGHVMRLHNVRRRADMCPDKWNEACDIAINRELIAEGYGIDGWWKPGIGPTPQCPFELEEDIYDWLPKPGGGGNQGQPSQGNQGQPQPSSGGGGGHTCSGILMVPGGPQAQQQVVNNVVAAMHAADQANAAGAVPGAVREIITKFLKPVVPWETAVLKWLEEKLDEDYTWARPSRLGQASSIYLPSRFIDDGRLKHIMCFQDVSGSIGEKDSIRFNSELKYLWETFKPELLTIVQFDTQIQKVDVLEDGDRFTEIEIVGRGGTCLKCVRDYIIEKEPDAVIIFSDMCVAPMEPLPPGSPTDRDILWIAVDAWGEHEVPHGTVISIKA